MNICIEKEYQAAIDIDYQTIITSVICEAVDYVNCPFECEVNVTITGDEEIRQMNREHRDIDKPTDVLSFPMIEYQNPGDFLGLDTQWSNFNPDTGELMLGDIVISYDKVLSQSREYQHSVIREIAFLTAHSMLHLFGYDHILDEERMLMEEMQHEILQNLGITREK